MLHIISTMYKGRQNRGDARPQTHTNAHGHTTTHTEIYTQLQRYWQIDRRIIRDWISQFAACWFSHIHKKWTEKNGHRQEISIVLSILYVDFDIFSVGIHNTLAKAKQSQRCNSFYSISLYEREKNRKCQKYWHIKPYGERENESRFCHKMKYGKRAVYCYQNLTQLRTSKWLRTSHGCAPLRFE